MLLGRVGELKTLSGCTARGEPVVVVGEAGVGKTTLLREAAARSGRQTYEGGALASLSWTPYLPLTRAVRRQLPSGDHAGIASFLTEQVGDGLLVIDDLHWADSDTLEVLELCVPGLTVLTAARRGDPRAGAVVERLENAGFTPVPLGGLGDEDAAEVVRSHSPGLSESGVAQVVEAAQGNPLMLEELPREDPVPATLALSLGARLQPHSDASKQVMATLALLGRPAGRDLVGDGLDELVEAGLVVEGADGLSPRHALLGEVALDGLDQEAKRRIHSSIAAAVEEPGEAARHHDAAGESAAAYAEALRAADQARWPGERGHHLGLAAAHAHDEADADRLRLGAATSLNEAGDYEQARELATAVTSRDPELQAAALLQLGKALDFLSDLDGALAGFAAGLELAGGTASETEFRLRFERARCALFHEWNSPEAIRYASEAVALARQVGAYEGEAEWLVAMAEYGAASRTSIDHAHTALAVAARSGDDSLYGHVSELLCSAYEAFGEPAKAQRLSDEMVSWARERRLGRFEAEFRCRRAGFDMSYLGNFGQAIAESEELLERPGLVGHMLPHLIQQYVLTLAHTGRIDDARRVLERWLQEVQVPVARQLLLSVECEVEWLAGRPDRALQAADSALAIESFSLNVSLVERSRCWAELDSGGRPSLDSTDSEPSPPSDLTQLDLAPEEMRAIALMAIPDRAAEAAAAFEELGPKWAGYELVSEVRCQWAAGECRLRSGDADRAREILEEVEQRAEALGLVPLLGRIRGSLRRAGAPRAAPREASGELLTGREREVLSLVREGLTSPEIAGRLGIARSTVDSQVKSAMTKLRAKSRRQAALIAAGDSA